MKKLLFGSMMAAGVASAVLLIASVGVDAQAPTRTANTWTPGRTPDGQPDIRGLWARSVGPGSPSHSLEEGSEPIAFIIQGRDPKTARVNIIADPADGRIPYQPVAAAERTQKLVDLFTPTKVEHVDPDDRCLPAGTPREVYAGPFQIVQAPGQVVFLFEDAHVYRVVPIDGRSHVAKGIKLWMGDSRGRWEGNTLVVDTTNHNNQTWFDSHGSFHSDDLHVVERFTLIDADTIRYEALIEDPKVFTRPWKIALPLRRNKEKGLELWEEACYEGERSVEHMLQAGRLAKEAGVTGIHTHDQNR